MATGVDTAGLVLAILPMLVNQLDGCVQGLQTIRTFRSRRYRRELESYLTRLGNQETIFLNTLEQSLEGVVDDEEEISDLIRNPQGLARKDAKFQTKLRTKLDCNYDAFVRTMSELSWLLEDLSSKLGIKMDHVRKVCILSALFGCFAFFLHYFFFPFSKSCTLYRSTFTTIFVN